jgi:hypothetical protein
MTKIHVHGDADPAAIMNTIARTADDLGFALEVTGPATAVAHDGGAPVSGNATATKARIGIEIDRDVVELRSQTSGVAYAAAGSGFFTSRINWRVAKFTKRTKKALAGAGLA